MYGVFNGGTVYQQMLFRQGLWNVSRADWTDTLETCSSALWGIEMILVLLTWEWKRRQLLRSTSHGLLDLYQG